MATECDEHDAKKLRKAIGQVKALLTRTEKYIKEQSEQVLIDRAGLSTRVEELHRSMQNYQKFMLDLLMLNDEDPAVDDETEDRYFKALSDMRRLLDNKSEAAQQVQPSKGEQRQHSRLPSLDIATFSGQHITEYRPFMDMFKAVVDQDKSLSAVEKLFYLKRYLQGDALLLINSLPLVNDSYSQALLLLDKRYDNKCLIITHHINALLDLQPIPKGTSKEFRHLVSEARQHIGALQNLGQKVQYWDMILIPILLRKLDPLSSRIYYSERDVSKLPDLEGLLSFIERRAMGFEEAQVPTGKSPHNKPFHNNKAVNLANSCDKVTITCKFCKNTGHKIFACKEFQALSTQDRIDFSNKEKLCKICLNSHSKKCNFHFKCTICKSKDHNSLLHSEENVCNFSKSTPNSSVNSMVLLPTIKVNFKTKDGSYVTARGLVDSGSQVSFIKTNLLSKLNIPAFKYDVNVTALGQVHKPITKAVNLSMYSRHDHYSCNALFSVVEDITSFLPQTKCDLADIAIPSTIQLADDEYNVPGEIEFLLSADIFFKILLSDKISLSRELFLLATKYGYIISGQIKKDTACLLSQNISNNVVMHTVMCEEQGDSLTSKVDSLLEKFMEEQHIPEIQTEGIANTESDVCELEFKNSVKLENNRFQVSLPLKLPIEEVNLGDSFNKAFQRLNVLCKKFQKDKELKDKYTNFINEYLALGHAKKVDLFKLGKPLDSCYFLAHHAVIRLDSLTTRLRVVFDGSGKTDLNLSLNDVLHSGPVVQNDLFNILILFRTYKFVAMADIKQMYRQVKIEPSQTHLQLILWKENLNDPLSCLQLQTVTYGVTSSSFLATRCLVELARLYAEQYPKASSVILNNSYVDDFLFGSSTIPDLQSICQELIELTGLGSFELHKWSASHPSILTGIDPSKQQHKNVNIDNTELTVKALGLQLNLNSDKFIITQPCGHIFSQWTKRTVLSFIGSFFDPLGLAGPIVTRAKEFLQKVWQLNLEWDVPLPDQILFPWNSFFGDLMNMKPITISRYLFMSDACTLDLIGYCDASSVAYGACIYIRAAHKDGVYVTLVCSKSRIAPMKTKQTIPRLELNACVLLSKLFNRICNLLQKFIIRHKVLHSDSQIALCWLQNPPKDTYVRRRALSIRDQNKHIMWSHVSGSCNPADCLSRGLMPSELNNNMLWWHGPPELKCLNYIPVQFDSQGVQVISDNHHNVTENNLTMQSVNCNNIEEVLPLSKFSSFLKLQHVVCYMLRFIKNCRKNKEDRVSSIQLHVHEYRLSMQVIIKNVQMIHFHEEINCIKNSKNIKSNLKKLSPFLDDCGILRVGGRLDNANIPFTQKHPIILPKNCHVTKLVIQHEHLALLHAGLKLTLASLSTKYYILSATTLVKSVINKCVLCFRFRAEKAQQLMAALPQDRVVQDKVFSKVGMDYCGPFNIKQSSMRRSVISKGYVCVFVCFITKCVHLELVSDLTTECFIAAFKRFTSRRGVPNTVYCDNASTFRGANNLLRQLYVLCQSKDHQSAVIDYCNVQGVDFKFIPSYSPTWGGLWEAAVKSAKYHFKRIIGNLNLTYEQFNTVIIQVEGILNSRPITPFTSDVSDFSFLTPAHFLINRPMTALPEPECKADSNINYLSFWKKCSKIRNDFWKVWHKSYLSQLLSRPKWLSVKPNVEIGMLVLLIGENVSPLLWPVGRVIDILKSKDNLVRAVKIKTVNGYVQTRAINKIAILPIHSDN